MNTRCSAKGFKYVIPQHRGAKMSAPIGSLLDKTKSRSKRERKHFPEYIALIRQCPCLICGAQAEAAHVRMSSAEYKKLNGRDDHFVVPLCPGHHRLYPDAQHTMGERQFWTLQGIDPLKIAKRLWEANDLEKMQEICAGII